MNRLIQFYQQYIRLPRLTNRIVNSKERIQNYKDLYYKIYYDISREKKSLSKLNKERKELELKLLKAEQERLGNRIPRKIRGISPQLLRRLGGIKCKLNY